MAGDLRELLGRRLDHRPGVPEGGEPAAVLVPLIDGAEPHVVFTLRTETLRQHGGEVSFPGGRRHAEDRDLRATALRETREEIGVPEDAVEVIGALPPVHTWVSGFIVVPYVGVLAERPAFVPNPDEIAEILEVPLRGLLAVEREVELHDGMLSWTSFAFDHAGHTIWGATARMLKSLLDVVREEGWG